MKYIAWEGLLNCQCDNKEIKIQKVRLPKSHARAYDISRQPQTVRV